VQPRLIRTELDDGASTWMPYGISVDLSEWEKQFLRRCDQLVEDFKARRASRPPTKKKK
jgi:hypothetical protein